MSAQDKQLSDQTQKIIQAVNRLNLDGNTIPHSWLKKVTFPSNDKNKVGKPDLLGIMILAEIIYWYRPKITKDEYSGDVLNVKKRFKADMLQRSSKSFAIQFGCSDRQARDALSRLEHAGLIRREFRTVTAFDGRKMNNIAYIEPVPGAIAALDDISELFEKETKKEGGSGKPSVPPYGNQLPEVWQSTTRPMVIKRNTYTDTTTKTTTDKKEEEEVKEIEPASQQQAIHREVISAASQPEIKNDAHIGESLTESQTELLKQKLLSLGSITSVSAATLENSFVVSLLDKSQFKGCQQDFSKKLNTIAKCFKSRIWSPESALASHDAQKAEQTKRVLDTQVSELNFKSRTLRGDIAHFEEFLKQNLNPDDLSDALPIYAEKQRELERIKAKLHGLQGGQAQKKTNLTRSPSAPQVKHQTQRISTELCTEPVDNLPGDARGKASNRGGLAHEG